MIKGFKDFLMRGNVIDLAVAVVVGAAFKSVVDAFAKDVIGGIIGSLGGQPNFDQVTIGTINIGTTVTALISFLIVASAVYFLVVVPVNRLSRLGRRPEGEKAPTPADIALLTEIRDLLAARQAGGR
jgi:large conductance mechanosensitive channel